MFERLVRVRGQLAELVTAVDPDAVSGPTAREWWAEFDRIERLGAAGKTLLARRIAQTHRPARQGTKTAAEELARKSGSSTGAAKDSVETSNRLPEQPRLQQALRGGALSTAQVALISSAAAANPAEEARLVELASRVSLGELREECARVRAAADPDPEATNRRLHAQRQLREWTDGEGFWNLHAKGTPQAGAAFNTALQPIIDRLFRDAYRQGRREPVQAYAFDALMHLAEHATGHCDCHLTTEPTGDPAASPDDGPIAAGGDGDGADHSAGGVQGADDPDWSQAGDARQSSADNTAADTVGADSADGPEIASVHVPDQPLADPPSTGAGHGVTGEPGIFTAKPQHSTCGVRPRASVNPRYLALLRVDVQALRRGRVASDELCEIAGVGPVPVTVAREVLSEAIVKLVITDGVDVRNVTHLGRGPTAAQRAALLWMSPICSVLGCTRARLENDHREPWAETRHTRLDELDPLCEFHHDLKTRLGWALVNGKGKRAFVAPDDPRHPACRTPRTDRPRPGRPLGGQRSPDRPPDRPPERTEPSQGNDTTRWRPTRGRPQAPTAGAQPGLFEDSQPP